MPLAGLREKVLSLEMGIAMKSGPRVVPWPLSLCQEVPSQPGACGNAVWQSSAPRRQSTAGPWPGRPRVLLLQSALAEALGEQGL